MGQSKRNCWSSVLLAIKVMLLVAFTAHTVLGCCAAHGHCMERQAVPMSDACCDDHNHSSDDQEFAGKRITESPECMGVTNGISACFTDGLGHTRHCEDEQCVFGDTTARSVSIEISFAILAWNDCAVSISPKNFLDARYTNHHFGELVPWALANRSVIQVWLI
jgi:hypothetical protein